MLAWDKHMNKLLISAFLFFFYLFEIFISYFILWLSIEAIIIKLKLSNNWKCQVSLI